MEPAGATTDRAPTGTGVAVRARGATLTQGRRPVLRDVDLDLPAAAVTVLVGPNGSGKSTLLSAIAGLIEPVGGSIEVLGTDPVGARRGVAYVLQATQPGEIVPLTVREVVTMGRYGRRGAVRPLRRDDRAAVERAMRRLDVVEMASRHLTELSAGQRQRVFIAQALAQEADVLLLDEPDTGLDVSSQQRVAVVVGEERAAGRTVIVATHELADAREADHVVLLAGRVVAAGSPETVLTTELLGEAYGGHVHVMDDGTVVIDDPHHHHRHHGTH